MKSAIFFVHNGNGNDEFGPFRSEGRYAIHYGLGFADMGYDVEICCLHFDPKKNFYKNASLVQYATKEKQYDLAFSYSGTSCFADLNYSKAIFMGQQTSDPINFKKVAKAMLVSSFEKTVDGFRKEGYKVDYLPPLFPIPTISKDFYKPSKLSDTNLKIFINFGAWGQLDKYCVDRVHEIVEHLSKKYKLEIRIICTEAQDRSIISLGKNVSYYPWPMNYKTVIDAISWSDVCITCFALWGTSMQQDIVSLGKLMISIEGAYKCLGSGISPLAKHSSNFIYRDRGMEQVDYLMNDPIERVLEMQEDLQDMRFDNWKRITERLT